MAFSNAQKQARHRARRTITPEQQDIDEVDREYGPLPAASTLELQTHRWRLYVAQALVRMARQDSALERTLQLNKSDRRG